VPASSAFLFLYRTKARYAKIRIATPPMPRPTPRPIDAPEERPLELGAGTGVAVDVDVDADVVDAGDATDVASCGGGAVEEGGADVLLVDDVAVKLAVEVETASVVRLKYCEYALSLRGCVVSSGWKARKKTFGSRLNACSSTVQLNPALSVSAIAFAAQRQSWSM